MQHNFNRNEAEPDYAGADLYRAGSGLVDIVVRFRWIIAGAAVVAAAAAFGLSFLQATAYEAEATMLLTDPRTAGVFDDRASGISDLSRYVRNQAEFAESTAVAVRAAQILDTQLTVMDITEAVSAIPSRDLDLVTIRATQPTPEGAAALADAVGAAYQQLVAEQVVATGEAAIAELSASKAQLQARVDALEAQITADPSDSVLQAERDAAITQLVGLDARIEQIDINMALYGSGVQYFESAAVPTSPAAPKPWRNAAAAAVLGLLAAGIYAWWRSERAPLAEARHDPAPVLGAPLLGEIPDFASVGVEGPAPAIRSPDSVAAEAYQFLVSSIEMALGQIGGSAILVTSVGPGEGKTVTSLNLSAAASGNGLRVLLVDADERARGLTRLGGDRDLKGLTDVMRQNGATLRDCLVRWKVGDDRHVMVLPAGTPLPAGTGVFRSEAFGKAMNELRQAARLVVLDSPPVLSAAETIDIALEVDAVVLVVEQGTPLHALDEVRARLEMTGTPLLGYVFNRATRRPGRYEAYYSYGYGRGT